jgi:hypothetical protein
VGSIIAKRKAPSSGALEGTDELIFLYGFEAEGLLITVRDRSLGDDLQAGTIIEPYFAPLKNFVELRQSNYDGIILPSSPSCRKEIGHGDTSV